MKRFTITLILAASTISSPVFAALSESEKDAAKAACTSPQTEPKKGAEACTTLLDNAKMGPKSTMAIYYYRGAFYAQAGNREKAKADFTTAIGVYDKDPDKANWSNEFVGLVASSYSFRAQIEEANKNCVAARADYKAAGETAREISERVDYEKAARRVCK